MPDRLSLDDGRLFPVQCLFNAIPDFDFLTTIRRMLCGIGVTINDAHCNFPADLDPGEESFEGIRFSLFEDSVLISSEELRSLICTACHSHLIRNPDDRDEVNALLKGNPFRPVTVEPIWLTSTVVALAQGIYADRAFDRMPILADALQDAGCYNDDILIHCRDESLTHVRGCWVVDLLLGKS